MNDVTIGTYSMQTDFNLYLPDYVIPAPAPQTKFIQIIGRDGAVDLSEALGIHYDSRKWTLDFKCFAPSTNWHTISSSVMNAIHGKRLNFSFADDPDYFWTGRISVVNYLSKKGEGTLRLEINSDPFKYKKLSTIVTDTVPKGTSYSGNPATFTATASNKITSLVADIDPVQDLHGYSKPWPAGGGKNKLPVSTKGSATGTVSFTNNNDGSWVVDGSSGGSNTYAPGGSKCISLGVLSAGNYSASLQHTDGQLSSILGIRIGEGSDATYLASGVGSCTFTADGTSEYWFAFMLPSNKTTSNELVWLQVEAGSVTSYAPYSNICPITGRTGVEVYRTGKNLCRVAFAFGTSQGVIYTENADGTVHAKGTATAESFSAGSITGSVSNIDSRCMYTVPAGTYTISNISGVRIWVQFRNADNTAQTGTNVNIAVGASYTITFTEPAIIYIRSDIATGTVVDTDMQVMVTEGSTAATVYEPWQKQTVTVDWTSVAGTQYRGTLDPVTGKLTVTSKLLEFDGVTNGKKMNNSGSYPGFNSYYSFYSDGKTYGSDVWVSKADAESDNACCSAMPYFDETAQISYTFRNNAEGQFQLRLQFPTSAGISTLAAANQWLNDLYTAGTPCTICYPLETPVEYQLTPQQVQALVGTNNVWADTGAVELFLASPIVLHNSSMPTVPTVTASAPMTLMWGNYTYSMQAGTAVIPQLVLGQGDTNVYVDGTGTINFEYSEGSL